MKSVDGLRTRHHEAGIYSLTWYFEKNRKTENEKMKNENEKWKMKKVE